MIHTHGAKTAASSAAGTHDVQPRQTNAAGGLCLLGRFDGDLDQRVQDMVANEASDKEATSKQHTLVVKAHTVRRRAREYLQTAHRTF